MASALAAANFCTFSVSAPAGERSAQSHSVTIGRHLHAFNIPVEGAEEAFAVDGTPADSVMLGLNSPLFQNPSFDMVVSGINRGDNCGLHVIYSGTVGAAREGACHGLPAVALSLDSFAARSEEQYSAAATYSVVLIRALLGLLPGVPRQPYFCSTFCGTVVSVNMPAGAMDGICGYYLAHQGDSCASLDISQLEADPQHLSAQGCAHAGSVTLSAYRIRVGEIGRDMRPGSDSWAVEQQWVAVTPLCLRTDVPMSAKAAARREGMSSSRVVPALTAALVAAAAELGVQNPSFDLVVSGINRGDNCGLHVIYSGTVGTAREAACKDVPAIALSLDSYQARTEEQYEVAASYCVALIKAMLGLLPGLPRAPPFPAAFRGSVINVNLPKGEAGDVKGAGFLRPDQRRGSDSWAVHSGWVAVTPIGLRSDMPLNAEAAAEREDGKLVPALAAAVAAAAAQLGVKASGLEGVRQLAAAATDAE
eukprot:scaffold1.g5367.t1